MSQSINDVFNLPFGGDLEELLDGEKNICIVGLFGKSDGQEKSKGLCFNQLLKSPVFKVKYVGQASMSDEEDEVNSRMNGRQKRQKAKLEKQQRKMEKNRQKFLDKKGAEKLDDDVAEVKGATVVLAGEMGALSI